MKKVWKFLTLQMLNIVPETDHTVALAPIFDNGASFYPKKSTLAIEQILKLPEADQARNNTNVQEPFTIDGEHHLNYRSILDLTESEIPAAQVELLKAAVISNTELVESKLNEIIEFVKSILAVTRGTKLSVNHAGNTI